MKKILILSISIFLASVPLMGQDLETVYKTGEIAINPDANFSPDQVWASTFGKSETSFKEPIRNFGKMVMTSDGSMFILNRGDYSIYKFNQNGKYVSKFGKMGWKTGGFRYRPSGIDILDNKYVITSEYSSGRINVFDLNGNFVKAIQMDYPISDCIALKNNLIAVRGFVLYKSQKYKYHIAVINIETEREKAITHFMEDRKNRGIFTFRHSGKEERERSIEERKKEAIKLMELREQFISIKSPSKAFRTFINKTSNGDLIVGYSKNPDIVIYSPEGKEKFRFKLDYTPHKITQKEIDEYYESMKNVVEKYDLHDSTYQKIKSPDFFPTHTPYFYSLIVDSEDNILVFKYVEEKNHVFRVYRVYSKDGQFVSETTINPGEYENPKLSLLSFFSGDLYGIFQKKDEKNKIEILKVDLVK